MSAEDREASASRIEDEHIPGLGQVGRHEDRDRFKVNFKTNLTWPCSTSRPTLGLVQSELQDQPGPVLLQNRPDLTLFYFKIYTRTESLHKH